MGLVSRRGMIKNIVNLGTIGLGMPSILGLVGCESAEVNSMSDINNKNDNELNDFADFYMPAEDEAHLRTFMQLPTSLDVYGAKDLARVQKNIISIANAISEFEPVVILASEANKRKFASQFSNNVEFWDIDCDDLWCRDSGPTFIKNDKGQIAISHIKFNGWGQKQKFDKDGNIASLIAQRLNLKLIDSGLYGEQGAVESDGDGTLLAHISSWQEDGRNNESIETIGVKLNNALGAKKIIWADGIKGEDITDYHIDSLARFVGKGHLLFQNPEDGDKSDPWYRAAMQTLDVLKNSTDADGNKLKITTIESPIDIRSQKDDFVSSYVNYYVCNGGVICAQFGDEKADKAAQDVLQSLYPNRKIIALEIDAIGESGGGIHCATQQQPKV